MRPGGHEGYIVHCKEHREGGREGGREGMMAKHSERERRVKGQVRGGE